jgi:hypothetical protein
MRAIPQAEKVDRRKDQSEVSRKRLVATSKQLREQMTPVRLLQMCVNGKWSGQPDSTCLLFFAVSMYLCSTSCDMLAMGPMANAYAHATRTCAASALWELRVQHVQIFRFSSWHSLVATLWFLCWRLPKWYIVGGGFMRASCVVPAGHESDDGTVDEEVSG